MPKRDPQAKQKQSPPASQTFKREPVPDHERRAYLADYFQSVEGQTDLVCAIVAAAYLEGAVITLLHNYFVKCSTKDSIFKTALGDFFKCCQMARCLGFLNAPMLTNLEAIGHIRNTLAHSRTIRSFDHEDIKPLCLALKLPKAIQEGLDEGSFDLGVNKDLINIATDPAVRFKKVARSLLESIALMADVAKEKSATQRGLDIHW